jgi:NADH:ubiquinone oxidoreductase subunit
VLRWLANNALGTALDTWWGGQLVGTDPAGNRYYRGRGARPGRRERRWVVYAAAGEIEPSSVPPGWHAWLHHNLAAPPSPETLPVRAFARPHEPNATGTAAAYLPPGHELRGGRRRPATGDYEAWRPDD